MDKKEPEFDIEDNDKKVKQARQIPLTAVICIALVCVVLSVLTTFALCEIYREPQAPAVMLPTDNDSGEGGDDGAASGQLAEIPSYFKDLIELDKFFNELSYDGFDEDEMREAILDAYVYATGDIYAEYLNAEELEDYMTERNGEFVGIGVSIVNTEIEISGRAYKVMEVISVYKDSPALEHGVMVGDCIMYVDNGGELTLVDVLGYTKALDVMLGEAGTNANFVVFRPEGGDYREISFSIERRLVISRSVTYRVSESDSRVGIINITGFDLTTPTQFKEAVSTLKDELGCKYFVFDVRNNPGGSLDSIEAVLSYFLSEGDEIVSTVYANGAEKSSTVQPRYYVPDYSGFDVQRYEIGMYKDLNCIVLTNENTASAAELFTATLRDYGLSKVVGTTTYGKGCMQGLYPLEEKGIEGGLKLTIAMYYSKSKTVYHGTGIVPDYEVDLSDEAKKINFFLLPEDKDAQLQKAIEILTK